MSWESLTYEELRKEKEQEKVDYAVDLIYDKVDSGIPYNIAFYEATDKVYGRFHESCGRYTDSFDEEWIDYLARESIKDNLEIDLPSIFERNRYE